MRSVIHANAESVDQLATQPPCDTAQCEGDNFQQEQLRGRCGVESVSASQPDECEDRDDNDVGSTWSSPIRFARVPVGMANQSINPNTGARRLWSRS
jgi:hypothetical protein